MNSQTRDLLEAMKDSANTSRHKECYDRLLASDDVRISHFDPGICKHCGTPTLFKVNGDWWCGCDLELPSHLDMLIYADDHKRYVRAAYDKAKKLGIYPGTPYGVMFLLWVCTLVPGEQFHHAGTGAARAGETRGMLECHNNHPSHGGPCSVSLTPYGKKIANQFASRVYRELERDR